MSLNVKFLHPVSVRLISKIIGAAIGGVFVGINRNLKNKVFFYRLAPTPDANPRFASIARSLD